MEPVRLSDLARTDLEEIWLYIAQDNPAAADRFIERVYRTCRKLARVPGMGRSREGLGKGLLVFRVGDYLVFYRTAERGIDVARILSGYRDLETLFGL